MFQYQTYETENNEQPLKLLARQILFYPKHLDANRFPYPKSFNFAGRGFIAASHDVHLVLLAKTFNVSEKIGKNKFVLCSANVPTHIFILRFSKAIAAMYFYTFVENDLNHQIPCSADWITEDLINDINRL